MSGTCIRHVVRSTLAAPLLVAPGTLAPRDKHNERKREGMQDFGTQPAVSHSRRAGYGNARRKT